MFNAWRWLLAALLLLCAVPAQAETQAADDQADAEGNPKYQITIDNKTTWQPFEGKIQFNVTGLDVESNLTRVTAHVRWKVPGRNDDWRQLTPVRIAQVPDPAAITFAVTLPLAFRDRPNDVSTLLGVLPEAELRIRVVDRSPAPASPAPSASTAQPAPQPAASTGSAPAAQPAPPLVASPPIAPAPRAPAPGAKIHITTVHDIVVTADWISGVLAILALIIFGITLYSFACKLHIPGGFLLRVISTGNGWASLAQFQVILWTAVIGAGAVYVMTLTGSLIEISTGTLILLGIAGGSAVGSQIKTSQQPLAAQVPPAPVTGLAQDTVSPEGTTLSWLPPSGGSAAAYTVQFKEQEAAVWRTATTLVANTRFRIAELEPGKTYDVQVFATNAAGSSAPAAIKVVLPDDPTLRVLPEVQGLRVTSAVSNTMWLSWNSPTAPPAVTPALGAASGAPTAPGSSSAPAEEGTRWMVAVREHDSDQDWRTVGPNVAINSWEITGLAPDTDYDIRIWAINAGQSGKPYTLWRRRTGVRIPRWSDIVTDTDRRAEIDVSRVQMLLFTVISATFVALKIAQSGTIPDVPESFVTLMGISNGVYLTSKFVNR